MMRFGVNWLGLLLLTGVVGLHISGLIHKYLQTYWRGKYRSIVGMFSFSHWNKTHSPHLTATGRLKAAALNPVKSH